MTLRATSSSEKPSKKVTLLVLGAGWTYQFLHPLLQKHSSITYAATTSSGHDNTIPFKFDPESDELEPFEALPLAEYVVVTFPLKGKGPSKKLVDMYGRIYAHASTETKWIQLGSTGIFTGQDWNDASTPVDPSNERGIAEEELIGLGGCVLNLAGLYGAQRQPGNWISRVAKTYEQLAEKGALHLIHGVDVARAIIAVVQKDIEKRSLGATSSFFGRRWIIADCVSYDWWSVLWDLSGETEEAVSGEEAEQLAKNEQRTKYRQWVIELMIENGVKGLPRPPEVLGRKLDAREFWLQAGMLPERTLKR